MLYHSVITFKVLLHFGQVTAVGVQSENRFCRIDFVEYLNLLVNMFFGEVICDAGDKDST